MDKLNHPYFLASAKINFSTNFYKKYILSQKGGKLHRPKRKMRQIKTYL